MDKKRLLAIIEVTNAVIAWGISFVATKVALKYVSPTTVVWLRFGLGVLTLGIAMQLRKQFSLPKKQDLAYFTLLGFLGIAFHQWLQSTGLVTAQAATSSWLVSTSPVFMALLGWIFLREKLSGMQIFGILLAAGGVAVVATRGDLASLLAGNFGEPGNLLLLLSAPNWALFSALSRRGLKTHPATQMMFYVMVFGWLFISILFFARSGLAEVHLVQWDGWLAILFLGVVCSGLAYIFWYDGLQTLPVAQTGAFLYVEPFVTVVFAALILAEPLLISALVGGLCILLGVWLVNRKA